MAPRTTALSLLLLVALVAALAVGVALADDPTAAAGAEASTEVPLAIPAVEKNRRNPMPATEENLVRGMSLYTSQCAMCHGALGRGDGDLADTLKITMPDFSDPQVQKSRTDGELFYILTHGHGRMPGEGERLPEDWRWSMIHAVRTMKREK